VIGIIGHAAAIAALVVAQAGFANAANLNVYSTIAMRGALEELVPVFHQYSKRRPATRSLSPGAPPRR